MTDPKYMNDHDLLIRLDEKLEALRTDVKDLKDGFAKRLDTVETDVEALKEWKWKEAGAIAVALTALQFLSKYLWK
jgi:hypothetical protein